MKYVILMKDYEGYIQTLAKDVSPFVYQAFVDAAFEGFGGECVVWAERDGCSYGSPAAYERIPADLEEQHKKAIERSVDPYGPDSQ
jgi:hypothetical protein